MVIDSIKIYLSSSLNPIYNMAYENWLIDSINKGEKIIFLWRNNPSIIMGRFQNPWLECNPELLKADNIYLLRRLSGGGTVYHDPGNLNCSFIGYSKDTSDCLGVLVKSIKDISGLNAIIGPKGSLQIKIGHKDYKISGSAFRRIGEKFLHHITLLVSANLDLLKKYLTPSDEHKGIIEGKYIASTRVDVENLSSYGPIIQCESLMQFFVNKYIEFYRKDYRISLVSNDYFLNKKSLKSYHDTLKDHNWIFGKTPQFNYKVNLSDFLLSGVIEVIVEHAIVSEIKFSGTNCNEKLKKQFIGKLFNPVRIYQYIKREYINARESKSRIYQVRA